MGFALCLQIVILFKNNQYVYNDKNNNKKKFKVFTKLIIQLHQFCTKNIVENLRCSKKHFKYIIFCFIKVFHVLIHQLKFMFFFYFSDKRLWTSTICHNIKTSKILIKMLNKGKYFLHDCFPKPLLKIS